MFKNENIRGRQGERYLRSPHAFRGFGSGELDEIPGHQPRHRSEEEEDVLVHRRPDHVTDPHQPLIIWHAPGENGFRIAEPA